MLPRHRLSGDRGAFLSESRCGAGICAGNRRPDAPRGLPSRSRPRPEGTRAEPPSGFWSSIVHTRHEYGFDTAVPNRKCHGHDKDTLFVPGAERVPQRPGPLSGWLSSGLPYRAGIVERFHGAVANAVSVGHLVVDDAASSQRVDFVAVPSLECRTVAEDEAVE